MKLKLDFLNLTSRDIGIDLGTANILITLKGKGVIYSEPTVVAIDKESGDIVYTFDSLHEAGAYTHVNIANICYCCQGKRKSAGGYHWQYA